MRRGRFDIMYAAVVLLVAVLLSYWFSPVFLFVLLLLLFLVL